MKKKAIVLFSGGVDSTVALSMALKADRECFALSFDYGQRHRVELEHAKRITDYYTVSHRIIIIDPASFDRSSLVSSVAVPKDRNAQQIAEGGIPNTYVPARNTLFLAYAMGQAEILEADEIHAGFNAMDANPYPDCRPAFLGAFQALLAVATKQGIEGKAPQLMTPLIRWDKTEIIKQGIALKAPLHLTFSCYDPALNGEPCQHCDACILRVEGFAKSSKP